MLVYKNLNVSVFMLEQFDAVGALKKHVDPET